MTFRGGLGSNAFVFRDGFNLYSMDHMSILKHIMSKVPFPTLCSCKKKIKLISGNSGYLICMGISRRIIVTWTGSSARDHRKCFTFPKHLLFFEPATVWMCYAKNKYLDYIHWASKYEGMRMKEKSLNFARKFVSLNVGAGNYFKKSELALTASMMSREPKLL